METIARNVYKNKNGLRVVVEILPDFDMDTSWLGELTDRPPYNSYVIDRKYADSSWTPDKLRYFVPGNSYKSQRAYFQKTGYSRHEAHEMAKNYVQRDFQMLLDYYSGERSMVGVCVTLYDGKTQIGSSSVWNIDSRDTDYIERDVIPSEVSEAFYNAKQSGRDLLGSLDKFILRWRKDNPELSMGSPNSAWKHMDHDYQNNSQLTRHARSRRLSVFNKKGFSYILLNSTQHSSFIEFMQKYY